MTYYCKNEDVRSISIKDTQIFAIDKNEGWRIVEISFADDVPAEEINYLVVRLVKKTCEKEGEKE